MILPPGDSPLLCVGLLPSGDPLLLCVDPPLGLILSCGILLCGHYGVPSSTACPYCVYHTPTGDVLLTVFQLFPQKLDTSVFPPNVVSGIMRLYRVYVYVSLFLVLCDLHLSGSYFLSVLLCLCLVSSMFLIQFGIPLSALFWNLTMSGLTEGS